MPRSGDDIPIRPLFGKPDEEESQEKPPKSKTKSIVQKSKNRANSKTSGRKTMSSYSEIPFLARFAGSVSEDKPKELEMPTDLLDEMAANDEDSKESSSAEEKLDSAGRPSTLNYESSKFEGIGESWRES